MLLAVVAEKTGYPAEMLDLGMSLDADLGIDSIKRVEILSALQEKLPDAPAVKPEHLGTLHTLQDVADFLGRRPRRVRPRSRATTEMPIAPGADHASGCRPGRPSPVPTVAELLAAGHRARLGQLRTDAADPARTARPSGPPAVEPRAAGRPLRQAGPPIDPDRDRPQHPPGGGPGPRPPAAAGAAARRGPRSGWSREPTRSPPRSPTSSTGRGLQAAACCAWAGPGAEPPAGDRWPGWCCSPRPAPAGGPR